MYSTTSEAVTKKLKAPRYRVPDELVSDNGPQFGAEELRTFAQSYGFKDTRTSLHYLQSNGKAESTVKLAKKILRMARASSNYLALLNICNTTLGGHNISLAQRTMSSSTRTTLPVSASLLMPHLVHNSSESILQKLAKQQRYYDKGTKTLQQLYEGDRVKIQQLTPGQRFWTDGRVVKQVQPCSYDVQIDSKVYIQKYEPRDEIGLAVDPPEVTEEMPFATNKEESIPPESHQGESEPQLNNRNKEALPTHDNAEYRSRSRQVSVKPARLNDFVMD
ncbi:uncharacterized protein LOC141891644 [Acropora palmata]|uniref:uncharacterized protein LOC141891644 n=1 Tax=Acropora palmata TaxID=6131 RepID=UPI003DA0D44C